MNIFSKVLLAMPVLLLTLNVEAQLISPLTRRPVALHDYDGDGKTDLGIYRAGRFWYLASGSNDELRSVGFANPDDIVMSPDYDGDGKTDIGIYNRFNRQNWWNESSTGILRSTTFGNHGDTPIYADFDGDGKTDLGASYQHDSLSYWYYQSSDTQLRSIFVGKAGDVPVTGDFLGMGRDFAGAYSPQTGVVTFINHIGAQQTINTGVSGGLPVAGDFDGDGIFEVAVYTTNPSQFVYKLSSNNQIVTIALGQASDIPVIGDYDGDQKSDVGVFRRTPGISNVYYIRYSSSGQVVSRVFGDYMDEPYGRIFYAYAEEWINGSFTNSANAVQSVYTSGTPHTNRIGQVQTTYNQNSFLPLCAYQAAPGQFQMLANGGFNCLTTWGHHSLSNVISEANATNADLQIIRQYQLPYCDYRNPANINCDASTIFQAPLNTYIQEIQNNQAGLSRVLAWYGEEEATGCVDVDNDPHFPAGKTKTCTQRINNFNTLYNSIRTVDSVRPIFNLDIPLSINQYQSTWAHWGSTGNIKSQDSYPFYWGNETSIAANMDEYKKLIDLTAPNRPSWFTIQAHEQPTWNDNWHWKMPTAEQVRVQAFGGLIHGATGIIYFTVDSFISRLGSVIGIHPNPPATYNEGGIAADAGQRAASIAAWNASILLNKEIALHQKALMSPTANVSYQVGLDQAGLTATPIRTLLKKEAEGRYKLFVVNVDKKALRFKIQLPFRPVRLVSYNKNGFVQQHPSYENAFAENIEAFGVRVFEFR